MSQATPSETAQGYSPPSVTQFSVFLDNRVGKLLELLEQFEGNPECSVCALSVQEASDYAVVRIIPNSAKVARDILRRQRLPYAETNILIIELINNHTLSQLCMYLLGAELNIKFAYPLMYRPNGTPTIAMSVDDLTLAGQILRRKEFRLLGELDLPRF
ncbi:MAG: hypothetical protein KDA21_02935 [Phycisphaerales bacterium]|nr:hypothetical protein [Phycisphaerales bacterium]